MLYTTVRCQLRDEGKEKVIVKFICITDYTQLVNTIMVHQLFQFLFILGFCIIYSYQWDTVLNLDESDQLLCYSCKGKECETIDHEETNTIVCNKQTQLCWVKKDESFLNE